MAQLSWVIWPLSGGPNNMGKTYISYAIYGLLRHFKQWIDLSLYPESALQQLRDEGTLVIELKDYQEKLSVYLKRLHQSFPKPTKITGAYKTISTT